MHYQQLGVDTAIHYVIHGNLQTIELPLGSTQIESKTTFLPELIQYVFQDAQNSIMGLTWDQRVILARQAEGGWTETEGKGTSVEIVRRLRDEWD